MRKIVFLLIFLVSVCIAGYQVFQYRKKIERQRSVHIALACPMSGEYAEVGRSYVKGISLYVKRLNQKGGIKGKKILLQVYDDKNDPETAKKVALEIAKANRSIAVIGHFSSSCSKIAGRIYRYHGIPVISPGASHTDVTINNDWYFRTIFSHRIQGRFLAYYLKHILFENSVSIIHEKEEYGNQLRKYFEKTAEEIGIELLSRWSFSSSPDLDMDPESMAIEKELALSGIVKELKGKKEKSVIFLCVKAEEGAKLVRLLRDMGIANTIIAPDSFSGRKFIHLLKANIKNHDMTSSYTEGMYVSSPLLLDTANEQAQKFMENYKNEYGEYADTHAAFARDSAMLILHALKHSDATCNKTYLKQDREEIKEYLASLDESDKAVTGVTGLNYFDKEGNSMKPLRMGIFEAGQLISARIQILPVQNMALIPDLQKSLENKYIIPIDNRYYYKTYIVYTGVMFNRIENIDIRNLTCDLDLHLWFRYRSDIKANEIVFLNLAGEIRTEPVETYQKGDICYGLYHVTGRFSIDFMEDTFVIGRHILGISFHHQDLTRNNLLYVTDLIGMRMKKGDYPVKRMQNKGAVHDPVISRKEGYGVIQAQFYQDVLEKGTKGSLKYRDMMGKALKYSVFTAAVRVSEYSLGIRRLPFGKLGPWLVGISMFMLVFGFLVKRMVSISPYSRVYWLFVTCFLFLLLLSVEDVLAAWMANFVDIYYMKFYKTTFDILWWLVPAWVLNSALKPFIWHPLEEHTARTIPNVVHRSMGFIILVLATFGIIAFVFDHRLTSLLATSGVVAMIIGLAIQMNISNIFAGIAINIESPFRIGDWVQFLDYPEGRVVDITWRTTRVKLRNESIMGIPNSLAAESRYFNYTYPDKQYKEFIHFFTDPAYPKQRVEKILLDAVLSTDSRVKKEPPPFTLMLGVHDWASEYLMAFFITEYGPRNKIRSHVWDRILVHMDYAGIIPAVRDRNRHMYLSPGDSVPKADKPREILKEIDIFSNFPHNVLTTLANQMKKKTYKQGESILDQGDPGGSLFIITEGAVAVQSRSREDEMVEVARLGAGHFFGEMALLTGEPRTATIVCLSQTRVYCIGKPDFEPLLSMYPGIMELLAEVLSTRKTQTESILKSDAEDKQESGKRYSRILKSIQNFFASS